MAQGVGSIHIGVAAGDLADPLTHVLDEGLATAALAGRQAGGERLTQA